MPDRDHSRLTDAVDHRAIIAGLSDADRAMLTGRVDGPGLMRLAAHGGLIALLGGLIVVRIPFWPVLLLPQGVLIVFLFTALHETVHETAFRTSWLNRATAALCGFLVFIPPLWFRYFHFAHHRRTHDPDHDPELSSPKPETWGSYLLYLSGIPYWMGMARTVLGNAAGRLSEPFVPEKGRERVVAEARMFLAVYLLAALVSLATGSTALLFAWVVPALIGQPVLRAYLLAEHAACPHVPNMLENTRTTFTTALVRFMAWNMPFHAEHHAYPTVPFHRLPAFHAIVKAHLKTTERGYVRFNRRFARALR